MDFLFCQIPNGPDWSKKYLYFFDWRRVTEK